MSKTYIKMLTETALDHLKKNIDSITKKVVENEDNSWIVEEFPQPMFVEKNIEIEDFELTPNPESEDKEIDFNNSIKIYESLNLLPRYILCDERFWLWLHFEKFYSVVKGMMKIRGKSTIENMWMHTQGVRRGIMFGVLSRCYFRVALTVDKDKEDKYELTRWVIENPLRYRELTWRSYSSESHLVKGIRRVEKRAVEETGKEDNEIYKVIAKEVSILGSVRLLDTIKEEDIEEIVYEKASALLSPKENEA